MSADFDSAKVAWVLDIKALQRLLAAVATATEVFLDLETTGLDEYAVTNGSTNRGIAARVALASLTLPQDENEEAPTTWVLPLSHPESPFLGKWRTVLRRVATAIVEENKPLVNHNVKFDARYEYATCGVDLSGQIVWDTGMSAHLLDENQSSALKTRVPATFGVPPWNEFDLTIPGEAERVPMFDLGIYAAQDTYWTWRLRKHHRHLMFLDGRDDEPMDAEEMEAYRLGKLSAWLAMPMTAALTSVEQRGILLDQDWANAELNMHRLETENLIGELAHRYDGKPGAPESDSTPSFAPTSNWFKAFTTCAVAEGDLIVAAMTPTGQPQWSKGVLVRQNRLGLPLAQDILDIRGHLKKAEFLASWLNLVAPDSRIHTTYHAARVVTGRLSSEAPNMQQVTSSLKPAFVAKPGWFIAELDYSQIELRVAAHVSNCKPMIEAFNNGEDLHRLLAARITGKEPMTVDAFERQAGKSANFGLLYGISPYGFQQYAEMVYGVSFTSEEAQAVHRLFYDTWVGIGDWHAKTVATAHRTGQVVSPIGRVRRLPGIFSRDDGMVHYSERAGVNSPVQGFASDLMQTAVASIEGKLPGSAPVNDVEIVGTVHDSLIAEVPADNYEAVVKECIGRMTYGVEYVLDRLGVKLTVPLAVEAKIGTRWGMSDVAVINS